jgi:hypothetical protein
MQVNGYNQSGAVASWELTTLRTNAPRKLSQSADTWAEIPVDLAGRGDFHVGLG